jgi:hypothetical protein
MKNKSLRYIILASLFSFALVFIFSGCSQNINVMTGSVRISGHSGGLAVAGTELAIVQVGVQAYGLIEFRWYSVAYYNPADRVRRDSGTTYEVLPEDLWRFVHVEIYVPGYVNRLVSAPMFIVPVY